MSLQAIWIIPCVSSEDHKVLFSRFYQIFIRKSKQLEQDKYVPIPANPEFAKKLLFELGYTKDEFSKFVSARDTCENIEQKPVYEITTGQGKLWPVVVVEQNGLLFCCLPFVPQGSHNRPPLIDIPGVTVGFTLMCTLAEFLKNSSGSEIKQKVSDTYEFLTQAAPFGTLVDTNVESVRVKMTNKSSQAPKTLKQPAWKPIVQKSKNLMYLSITEFVRCMQYDRENLEDVWDVYGTVVCKAELEGTMPTVTLTISNAMEGDSFALNHLLLHPCVQSADAHILEQGRERAIPRRIRFTPPTELLTLCHYTVAPTRKPPITGCFELFAENDRVKIKVNLKLTESIKNYFEYCELRIPFGKRGPLVIQESSQNHGSLLLSADNSVLVWNIGQRFPVKSTQIDMSAVVQLGSSHIENTGSLEEMFCHGQNAFAQLYFKIGDFTQSGCLIDPKSIQVSPNMKYKLTCVREFVSTEYKLWNVHGDSLSSTVPKCLRN